MMLNGRFSDLERRLLEAFQDFMKAEAGQDKAIILPDTMLLLVRRVMEDGLVSVQRHDLPISFGVAGLNIKQGIIIINLTAVGREFVGNLIAVTEV